MRSKLRDATAYKDQILVTLQSSVRLVNIITGEVDSIVDKLGPDWTTQSALCLNPCESLHLRRSHQSLSVFCLTVGEAEEQPLLSFPRKYLFNSMQRLPGGRAIIKTTKSIILVDRDRATGTLKLRHLLNAHFDDSFCYESLCCARSYPHLVIFTLTGRKVLRFTLENFFLE